MEDALEWLTDAGLVVTDCYRANDEHCRPITTLGFRGRGVRGYVERETDEHPGYLLADHMMCFDKYSKCPLFMIFPLDTRVLRRYLRRLGSRRGYRITNSYRYHERNPFPDQRALMAREE